MRVHVYATLRDLLGVSGIDLDIRQPTDARRLLRQVTAAHPALAARLWDEHEQLSGAVLVLVNGRAIRFLDGLATRIGPEDNVALFPPIGGR